MPASAIATFTSASSRAVCTRVGAHLARDRRGDLVVQTRRRAQARRAVVGPEDADEALLLACARSACRSPSPPRRFTSSKASRVLGAASCAGGAGTRNCSADSSTKGATSLQCAPSASGICEIGSWRQWPGSSLVGQSTSTSGSSWSEPSPRARRGSPPRRAARARCRSASRGCGECAAAHVRAPRR